jgi:hypothetical protein
MMMKKSEGIKDVLRVVSEHRGEHDGRYVDLKREEKRRSSNDLMRNRFPNRSIR